MCDTYRIDNAKDLQYAAYRTRTAPVSSIPLVAKSATKSKKPAWAQALDDHVRLSRASWSKIAVELDMHESAVRHWRNGTREPSVSQFLQLCEFAGVQPSTILSDPTDEQRRALLTCYDQMKSQERRDQLTGTATRLLNEEIVERNNKKKKAKVPS